MCCSSAPITPPARSWPKPLLEKIGRGRFRRLFGRSGSGARTVPEVIDRLKAAGTRRVADCAASRGTSSRARMRRAWISSSRSATRRKASSVPISARSSSPAHGPCPTRRNSRDRRPSATTLLNELYAMIRRRIEIFTSLPFDFARHDGDQGPAGRDRRHRARSALTGRSDGSWHQRNGSHRPAGAALCARGVSSAGERSARATIGSTSSTSTNSRAASRRPRISSNSTASTAAGTDRSASTTRRRSSIDNHAHRLQRSSAIPATLPGAISAATSCWNAPASF